jgi:hypothetical protein
VSHGGVDEVLSLPRIAPRLLEWVADDAEAGRALPG